MTHRIAKTAHGKLVHVGGRHRPIATPTSHPHLFRMAGKYMNVAKLPTAPDEYDGFAKSATAQADILANDQLGDCTAAGACHLTEAWTANAGAPVVLQRQDAVNFYSLSTGYDPTDPNTDQGGDEVTVCGTWRDQGLDGQGNHRIVTWLSVDPSNAEEVLSMAWLFGLYFGIELDSSWPQNAAPGAVWDESGTPNPSDGHCVVGKKLSRAQKAVGINTWGIELWFTLGAIAKFCSGANGGNVFAILSKESIASAQNKSPEGFAYADLLADLNAAPTATI